jgi:hypothetical protein
MIVFDAFDFLPASGNQAEEFIVLRNTSTNAVDLSGWTLEGGVAHTFEGGTVLPPGDGSPAASYQGLLHVVRDASAFRARPIEPTGGQRRFVQGNYQGQLSARGESVALRDETGMLIATMSYGGSPTLAQDGLRISEIHYAPAPPTFAELSALPGVVSGDFEFLELVNAGSLVLNLEGVTFTEGITFTFPEFTLGPGQRVVLAKNPAAFAVRYPGVQAPIFGPYDGWLDNIGEPIEFADAVGENVLDFQFKSGWYPATSGTGHSLVLSDPSSVPFDHYGDPVSWRISLDPGGSPGLGDTAFSQAYYGWDNFHFTSAERESTDIAGPFADPDHDGRPNWEEYAFDSNPREPDQVRIHFVWVDTETDLRPGVEFGRPTHALDLRFELLAADDLDAPSDAWTVVAAAPASATPIDDSTELVRFADTQSTSGASRFLRVRAMYVP